METVTYRQACELLGVKYVTIKDAVLYGRLTKCVTKGTYLLREQVALFKNKRISLNALTEEEKALWKEYKDIAENPKLLELALSKKSQGDTIVSIMASQKKLENKLEMAKEVNKMLNNCLALARELARETDIEMPLETQAAYPY